MHVSRMNKIIAASLMFVLVLLVGCAQSTPPAEEDTSTDSASEAPAPLEGTSWECITFAAGGGVQNPPLPTAAITAEFSEDGKMTGNTGVNSYSTSYETDGATLTIGEEIITTKMAGPEEAMTQESDYLTALATVESYNINGQGELILFGQAGNTVAKFGAAE